MSAPLSDDAARDADATLPRGTYARVDRSTTRRGRVRPWLIGVAGLAIAVGLALRLLLPYGMDPTIFVSFGNGSPARTAYMHRVLGHVTTRPDFWPDGKFYFVLANDPLLRHASEDAVLLDRPVYRAQRILYPWLAGGFGLVPPRAVPWSMLLWNVLAMAIGAALAAALAARWGAPPWVGVLVPLNIGLLFEFEIGGAGIIAYVCALAALLALERDRTTTAALWFGAATLSKEVMLAFALGVLVCRWREQRDHPWRIVAVPAAIAAAWDVYVRVRLAGTHRPPGGLGAFTWPFAGIVRAFETWTQHPTHLIVNVSIIAIAAMFVPVAIRSRLPIVWGALPFVGLAVFLSASVWRETFDLTRALTPVFTAIPFAVLTSERGGRLPLFAPREAAG